MYRSYAKESRRNSAAPPLERLADAYSQLRQDAEEQLLAKVKAATPEFSSGSLLSCFPKWDLAARFAMQRKPLAAPVTAG